MREFVNYIKCVFSHSVSAQLSVRLNFFSDKFLQKHVSVGSSEILKYLSTRKSLIDCVSVYHFRSSVCFPVKR